MNERDEKKARSAFLTMRLTDEERAKIVLAADRANLTVGSYMRLALLSAPIPRQGRRPPVERKELVRILGQLGHVGGNLNQLAFHANARMPVALGQIEDALADLARIRDLILKTLGREP